MLPPERRRALLETAAAEFAEAGYERASLNRIIRARGMSKSSFYHYFDSKEDLFTAVVADIGAALVEALGLPAPGDLAEGDFWARVEELTARLAGAARERPGFATLPKLFYLPDAPPSLAKTRALIDAWIDEALEVGRSAGAVGGDLPVSLQRSMVRAMLWTMDEWSVANMDLLSGDELERLAEAAFAAVKRLLSPSG
ncbi:hypothetical protein GCM10028833_03790 [Glycomyces tarimensis]